MKNIFRKIILGLLLSFAISSNLAFAATEFKAPTIPKPDLLPGPSQTEIQDNGGRKILIESVIPKFTIGFIGFVGGVALMFVVIGGVRYTMVYGNDEAAEKAKNQIIWAIAGFLLSILSYTIVTVINNLEYTDNATKQVPIATEPTNP